MQCTWIQTDLFLILAHDILRSISCQPTAFWLDDCITSDTEIHPCHDAKLSRIISLGFLCVYFPPMSVDCLSLMRVTSSLCWVNHFKTVSIKLFICHLLCEQSSIKPHIYRFYVHKLSLVWLLPMIYFHTLGLVQYSSQELAFSLIKRQRYIV